MNMVGGYAQTEMAGLQGSEIESRALIRAASQLNKLKESWPPSKADLNAALEKNRRLWSVLSSAMTEKECPQPHEVRESILSLASYVFKRTMEVLSSPAPEKLDILISINMNLANGLSGKRD